MDRFFAGAIKKQEVKDERTPASTTLGSAPLGPAGDAPTKLSQGVVLGKDGKPCRSCTSAAEWKALMRSSTAISSSSSTLPIPSTSSTTSTTTTTTQTLPSLPPTDCPPDVDRLGNHTWTLLHTISAAYPRQASASQRSDMTQFLALFATLYPCWVCADDFRAWMRAPGNEPRVEGREGLGRWMCEAHNEVNRKLGKEAFDCARWAERWRSGWADGRCD